jgi:hypothetical protein
MATGENVILVVGFAHLKRKERILSVDAAREGAIRRFARQ